MQPKSNNLFHFTRNIEFLKGILLNGFMPRYSLEDAGPLNIDYLAYPMVCFCDIPISRISEHTAFYGEYGIGMTKEWGLRNNLAPLIYTPTIGAATRIANFILNYSIPEDNTDAELKEFRNDLLAHAFKLIPMIKPISGNMIISGKPVEKDFSQESEWRYVPDHDSILVLEDFESKKEALNKSMESMKLEFTPADVRYIFVKADFEIPLVFDYIQANLGKFPLTDIKILISRIVSLETLARDV